jgi:hypothetical protein
MRYEAQPRGCCQAAQWWNYAFLYYTLSGYHREEAMPLKVTRAEDSVVWHLVKLPPDIVWALGELYLALRIPNKWKLLTAIIRPERNICA